MAKVVITIEDSGDDKVKVTSEPNFETMMAMDISGTKLTPAHGYAFFVINQIMAESKRNRPTPLLIPKLYS